MDENFFCTKQYIYFIRRAIKASVLFDRIVNSFKVFDVQGYACSETSILLLAVENDDSMIHVSLLCFHV